MLRNLAILLTIFTISVGLYSCNKKLSPVVEYDKVKYESFVKNDFDKILVGQSGDTVFIKHEKDAQGKPIGGHTYRYLRDSIDIHVLDEYRYKTVTVKTNCGQVFNKPTKTYMIPDIFMLRLSRKCFPVIVQIDGRDYKVNNTTDYSCVQFTGYGENHIKVFYSNQQFVYR